MMSWLLLLIIDFEIQLFYVLHENTYDVLLHLMLVKNKSKTTVLYCT